MEGGTNAPEALMPSESLSQQMMAASAPTGSPRRGMALSPGGASFENYIYRPETTRRQRKPRRIVHRNTSLSETLPETVETDENSPDPIQNFRKAAGYKELVDKCEPGAEIHRIDPAELSRRDDHVGPQSVDDVRRKLLSKIQTNVMQRRNQVLADRRSRGWEPDENSPLIGGDRRETEDYDAVSYDNASQHSLPFMTPDHLLPPSFYQIHLPIKKLDTLINPGGDESKASTLVTILAIWNTMMGTSLLSVPWAIKQSGLISSVFIGLLMALIAGYTAMLVIKIHAKYDTPINPIKEFAQLCGRLLGPKYEYISGISSMMAVTGAVVVYWVLMSNFLRNTVDLIAHSVMPRNTSSVSATPTIQLGTTHVICPGNNSAIHSHVHLNNTEVAIIHTDSMFLLDYIQPGLIGDPLPPIFETIWNKSTVPFFLLFLFPIISMRSVTFFTKFNVIGTVSVFFIIIITIYWAAIWGVNVNFSDVTSPEYVPMFESTFPSLSGMLALGLFIHNAIVTITRNHENPERNTFCVFAAFSMVITTYLFIGVLYYITFPLPKWCIEDNLMNNFPVDQVEVIVARILLLIQLIAIFPLICYIWRAQLLTLFNVEETMCAIIVVNALCVSICIFFAVFLPQIGTIIRFTGASCGFIMIFLLPCCCELVRRKYESNVRQWSEFFKLHWKSCSVHLFIIFLGFANMIAQFIF